ncbi:MAG TPA: hypothetical protein VKU41_32315 [Polyangiaceae bacterium]|nr:hypothetical protein [Polyangiaceae bacterium]
MASPVGARERQEVHARSKTDAAASVAAECVMLNKRPFVDEAVRVLSGILRRMEKHHYKKRSLFRKLRVSTFTEA